MGANITIIGGPFSERERLAMANANSPSAGNPLVTVADLTDLDPSAGALELIAARGGRDALGTRLDQIEAMGPVRLAAATVAGARTVTTAAPLHTLYDGRAWAVFLKPSNPLETEVRRILSSSGTTLTLAPRGERAGTTIGFDAANKRIYNLDNSASSWAVISPPGRTIRVTGSASNDGVYTIAATGSHDYAGDGVPLDPYVEVVEALVEEAPGAAVATTMDLQYAHLADDPVLILWEPVVNVLWFGADPSGVTDNFGAVRAAVRQALQQGTMGHWPVYFPTGDYYLNTNNPLKPPEGNNINKQGLVFKGDGWESSRLLMAPAGVTATIASINGDGTTVAVQTTAPHLLTTNAVVGHTGTTNYNHDGPVRITVTGADTYTYPDPAAQNRATDAAGTVRLHRHFLDTQDLDKLAFTTFEGLYFGATAAGELGVNGFRMGSSTHEQGFIWRNCFMEFLTNPLYAGGTIGNDSWRLFGCFIWHTYGTVLTLSNPQAVAIEFHGCNVDRMYGDGISVLGGPNGGGGGVQVYGGSWTMNQYGGSTTMHYLLRLTQGEDMGPGNATFLFSGIRTELEDAYSGLVYAPIVVTATYGGADVLFHRCNMFTVTGGARVVVHVDRYRKVKFEGCTLASTMRFEIGSTATHLDHSGGGLEFLDCWIPSGYDISNNTIIAFLGNYGYARGRNFKVMGDGTEGTAYALDFDRGYLDPTLYAPAMHLKVVFIFAAKSRTWPYNNLQEKTLKLPYGATVRAFQIHKPPAGVSTATYQLNVGNGDKSTTYVSSTSGQQKLVHRLTLGNVWDSFPNLYNVTADNDRTICLWSANGDEAQSGGMAVVEYY